MIARPFLGFATCWIASPWYATPSVAESSTTARLFPVCVILTGLEGPNSTKLLATIPSYTLHDSRPIQVPVKSNPYAGVHGARQATIARVADLTRTKRPVM
jgi:hypothetical protein